MALDSSPEQPQPLREIARAVQGWVERLGWVWVEGQIIQINRRAGTKTVFLTLRDPLAEVSASVTMSPVDLDSAGPLTEGARVVAHLRPTFFTRSGRLSFVCDDLRPQGEGRLLAQLEQRKRMLQAEGLFDPRRKRPLPFLPVAVGLITASASAAERDVIENARRRWPGVDVRVRHALMQGQNAVREIVDSLLALDKDPEVQVIVIARGGGALEDLLAFSDETLVRAVADCATPVVSAIGHETDTPILDLVADLRASTPTDAAKRVVPDAADEAARVRQAGRQLESSVRRIIAAERQRLDGLRSRPVLQDPGGTFVLQRAHLDTLLDRLRRSVEQQLRTEHTFVAHQLSRAAAMSPRATLERGYAIIATPEGETITSVAGQDDADLVAHLADGRLLLSVIEAISAEDEDPHDQSQEER